MKKEVARKDIGLESSLLKVMSVRNNFEDYMCVVDRKRILHTTNLLLTDFEKYFVKHKKHDEIDWGEFYTLFSQTWHKKDIDEYELNYYQTVAFPAIQKVSEVDTTDCLMTLVKRTYKQRMEEHLREEFTTESVNKLMHEFDCTHNLVAGDILSPPVEEDGYNIHTMDFSVLSKADGLPWVIPTLQAKLGNMTSGESILFVADTNGAKGLLVAAQLTHTFKYKARINDTRPILVFNSEGEVAEPMDRFLSNLLRKTFDEGFEQIQQEQIAANKLFIDTYKEHADTLWLFSMSKVNTLEKIRQKIFQYKPALVFIDIADKLAKERDFGTLTLLYDNIRQTAEEAHTVVISTSQAGNTKWFDPKLDKYVWKRWLDDKDIFGAKQKAAAATTMISIGMDHPDDDLRYINVSKCKRGTPTKVTCRIDRKFSRIEELDW